MLSHMQAIEFGEDDTAAEALPSANGSTTAMNGLKGLGVSCKLGCAGNADELFFFIAWSARSPKKSILRA